MINIPNPSSGQVKYYLKIWKEKEEYLLAEKSLDKLFLQTYPKNDNFEEILTKVCTLDVIYSANASRWFFEMSKHIKSLEIDKHLGTPEIVNEIARIKTSKGKERNLYSFATKYCSHHRPEYYPIYDSYVEKMLLHFRKISRNDGNNFDFFTKDLKSYALFRNTILDFRKQYNLNDFNLKEIDIYLWLAGKKYLANNYQKQKSE